MREVNLKEGGIHVLGTMNQVGGRPYIVRKFAPETEPAIMTLRPRSVGCGWK